MVPVFFDLTVDSTCQSWRGRHQAKRECRRAAAGQILRPLGRWPILAAMTTCSKLRHPGPKSPLVDLARKVSMRWTRSSLFLDSLKIATWSSLQKYSKDVPGSSVATRLLRRQAATRRLPTNSKPRNACMMASDLVPLVRNAGTTIAHLDRVRLLHRLENGRRDRVRKAARLGRPGSSLHV